MAPSTFDIVPDGDVLLICGTEEALSTIKVSSMVLSFASPVFKAMLAPKFAEGRTLASTGTVEIPLPEDEPNAMVIICWACHLQHDKVPKAINSNTLIAVARTADKYGCHAAMLPYVDKWFAVSSKETTHEQRLELLGAAKHLRDKDAVRQMCVAMVM